MILLMLKTLQISLKIIDFNIILAPQRGFFHIYELCISMRAAIYARFSSNNQTVKAQLGQPVITHKKQSSL